MAFGLRLVSGTYRAIYRTAPYIPSLVRSRLSAQSQVYLTSGSTIHFRNQTLCVRDFSCSAINQRNYLPVSETKMADNSQFVIPNDVGICLLECKTAFEGLTDKEKLYSHYLSQAAFNGSLICLQQTSPESPGIFVLLQKLFGYQSPDELKKSSMEEGLTEEEVDSFFTYAAAFYSNMGNYKSFGDTKFIPNLPKEKLNTLVTKSKVFFYERETMPSLWSSVKDAIYSLTPKEQELGLGDKGTTTYFSSNCDMKDAEVAQEFMTSKDLSAYNTRLFKYQDGGELVYEIRIASSVKGDNGEGDLALLGSHKFTPKGASAPVTFKICRGDYAPIMGLLVENLQKAKEYAANENEVKMLEGYIESFSKGSIPAHKQGSREWVKNKGPIVETYIGFIESYRDPFGVRGEFEGFVSMVNKEMSKKFTVLVEKAEHLLPLLPWPAAYEKDTFLRPDFTSLDVLAFGSSGIPAGINIPNYDDIRQVDGFKNVSLGNVLSSGYKDTKVTFLTAEDKVLYSELKGPSFEVQVGLHELLGHGSGKLFIKNEDGTFNFDKALVKDAVTGGEIDTWYAHNETYDGKFLVISSSYEECRAECVGIYLCLSSEVLSIFGHEGSAADNIIYINWLNMVRSGLLALEFYTPETNAWKQAHMQARFVILRVLIEAGEGLVTLEKITNPDDGQPDLVMKLDRSKIATVGKQAIGDFLKKLQVYKATGNYAKASEMYAKYSDVNDHDAPHFLGLRTTVMKRKQPRKMFVQCNTTNKDGSVELKEYESTASGLIQSFTDRFPVHTTADIVEGLWEQDKVHFK